MEAWVNNFISWVPIGGLYYVIVGLIAFFDSLAFIGILCPGSLLVFTGFLAGNGKGEILILMIICTIGSITGDLLSYVIGSKFGGAIMQRPWFKRRENLLQRAQLYFAAHGGKSVFIGRFVGFLRPFIPFIAGSAQMNPIAFTLYVLVSGVLWGIIFPGIGYLCGASWQMVQIWSGRFSLLILLLAALFILNALIWRYVIPWLGKLGRLSAKKIAAQWQELLDSPSFQSFCQRHPRLWSFLCQRFTAEHASGICLTIGLTLSTIFAAVFAWFGRGIPLSNFDQRIYELLAVFHHPWTDLFFAAITWVGSSQAIIILGAFALFTLIINNRDFSALVLVFGVASGELFAVLAKAVFARPRPVPLYPGLDTIGSSFPSGHAFSALLFYGLLIYFLIGTTRNWRGTRIFFLLFGSFIILLVGFSRIYLGVHWTSDVLAGFTLAAFWLTFLITFCETRFRYGGFDLPRGLRPFNLSLRSRLFLLIPAALLAAALIIISIGPFLHTISWGKATRSHQVITIEMSSALPSVSADLPFATHGLWGHPQRPLTLIVVADAASLQRRLATAGWRPATLVGMTGFKTLFIDLLQGRVQREATIIPLLVDGKRQDFSLVRTEGESDKKTLRSLLVWDLGRRLDDGRIVWGLLASQQIGVKHLLFLSLPLPLSAAVGTKEEAELAALFSPKESDNHFLILPLPVQNREIKE